MSYRVPSRALLAVAVALFLAAPALAESAADNSKTHEGTIVRVSADKLTMTTGGKEHSHALAPNARFLCDGKECGIADLKPGMKIKVTTRTVVTKIQATQNGAAQPADRAESEEAEQGARQGAMILVDLPANARLTFDGESTVSTGSNRLFVSPPLVPGRAYSYTVRAEWKQGDRTASATKKIMVRAGQETRVGLGLNPEAAARFPAEGESGVRLASAEQRKNEPLNARPGAERPGQPLNMDLEGFLREYDKNKDGGLTRDELPPELRSSFDHLDANKDGKVTLEELKKGMHHLRPARRPSDLIQVLIEMSDADDIAHGEVQRAYDILRKLDSDHDGKINPDELKAARAKIVENRVDYLFKELDANKDGKISHEEAKGMMLKNFAAIDRNKDGFIDREELTRAATEKPRSVSAGSSPRTVPPQR